MEERKKQISELVSKYYYQYVFLQIDPISVVIDKALNRFLNTDFTIEEIEQEILKIIEKFMRKDDPEVVNQNHEVIYSKLDQIIPKLQEAGVDYYLAGALCGYLKYGEESSRCHEDLDFMVNEEDLDKFQKVCEDMGFSFFDHRMNSPRVLKNEIPSGEHEVIATTPLSDFHIGVFCFERLVDGTFVMKGYYHDDENRPMCREEVFSSELAKEAFDSEVIDYKGNPLPITSPEYLYTLKRYTRGLKDLKDLSFLEGKIDQDKLARIKQLIPTDKVVQFREVSYLPEKKNDELEKMMDDVVEDEDLNKTKVLVKEDSSISEDGFVHKYAIVLTLLILAVIILIVFLVLKWLQII